MRQLDLTASVTNSAANPAPVAAPKLLHISDPALGADYTVAIGPESPWFELLPTQQSCTVTRHAAEPARTSA